MVLLAVQTGVWFCLVHPIHLGIVKSLAVTQRHLNIETFVMATGFQQQYRIATIGGQLVGKHATG